MPKKRKRKNRESAYAPCFEPEEIPQITNADRIRAMSDEELAHWICSHNTPDFCEQKCPVRNDCKFGEVELLVEWMKRPRRSD